MGKLIAGQGQLWTLKHIRDLNELYIWVRDKVIWYWLADIAFDSCQMSKALPRYHASVNLILKYGLRNPFLSPETELTFVSSRDNCISPLSHGCEPFYFEYPPADTYL